MTTRGYEDPLVREALKKSTIVWLQWKRRGVERSLAVWYVPDGDRLLVLSGERQQRIPSPHDLFDCTVVVRSKGKDILLAELPARACVIAPDSEGWDDAAAKLAEKRLNTPGLPQDTARRWREDCVIIELTFEEEGAESDESPSGRKNAREPRP